jgi:nitrite reductase/ring-hydroxylating ferredoxin subunit
VTSHRELSAKAPAPGAGNTANACAGCHPGRRAFLHDAALAAAFAAIGGHLKLGAVRTTAASGRQGEEVTYPIPAADGVSIDRANDTMVARAGGKVYVFARTCPHQNTALRWLDGPQRFQCPRHESKYRPDGTYIEGRATRSLDRFAVRKAGNAVVASLDQLYREDTDAGPWAAAFVTA